MASESLVKIHGVGTIPIVNSQILACFGGGDPVAYSIRRCAVTREARVRIPASSPLCKCFVDGGKCNNKLPECGELHSS